jgi:spore coat protein U-like protein
MAAGVSLASTPQGGRTANLQVSAEVVGSCRIGLEPLTFAGAASFEPGRVSPLDASAPMTLTCTRGTAGVVWFDGGANPVEVAGGLQRRMSDGRGALVPYQLYENAQRPILAWLTPAARTIYARAEPPRTAAGGNYSDTVTVTFTF